MRHDELIAAAYHEGGHALAIVLAFRDAAWLPHRAPLLPVRYVEVTADGCGSCVGKDVYSTKWPVDVLVPKYRDLMAVADHRPFERRHRRGDLMAFDMGVRRCGSRSPAWMRT